MPITATELQSLIKGIAPVIKDHVREQIARLEARIAVLEQHERERRLAEREHP